MNNIFPMSHDQASVFKEKARGITLGIVTAVACACVQLTAPAHAAVATSQYDALIIRARTGDYQPALNMLRHRLRQDPGDARALSDFALISSWAGDVSPVTGAYEASGSPQDLPAGALVVVGHAYRDARQWDRALHVFSEGNRRYPAELAFRTGYVMTLVDAGRTDDAIKSGEVLVGEKPGYLDGHLALAYAYRKKGEPYAALNEVTKAYALNPDKTYVKREYIVALQNAGIADVALELAKESPDTVSASDLRILQGDAAAQLTREAQIGARSESERFMIADRALAEYDALISSWSKQGESAKKDITRARIDRLHALYVRKRLNDVVTEYEKLLADGVTVPGYGMEDAAWSYLELRQPRKAAELFRKLKEEPGREDSADKLGYSMGLFYALVSLESFDEAGDVITKADEAQPIWRYAPGNKRRLPNDRKLDTSLARAMLLLYRDDLPEAQRTVDQMVASAPKSTSLRMAKASVYEARGLPRAAERELKIAETDEPRSLSVELAQGSVALDLNEWEQATLLSKDTIGRFPDDNAAQEFAQDLAIHNKAEVKISAYRSHSSQNVAVGGKERGVEMTAYSPPLGYNWRLYAGIGHADASYEEGDASYTWNLAGVEWRARDFTSSLEVSANRFGHGTKPGLDMSVAYDVDDHWQVGGTAGWQTRSTPLRALNQDVKSNTAGTYVQWRGDERREWRLAANTTHFSDGNDRYEIGLTGKQRLYTLPHFYADARMEISASRNTEAGTYYFNPERDLAIVPSLDMNHVIYRRYDTVWSQNASVGAGMYSQHGYGNGAVYVLTYGQRLRLRKVFDAGVQVTGISRPYDGDRDREVRVSFDMNYRF
ncbi:poly-beta-1,6 N-acetyl-D-glucosamine export porin PgaA [Allopusillimonas ginsengisoli]|uniref:poly-beta-1,6 N-acetyl-D-glucosamine export porin PgaA n=1 Tax=Allopusillimonas ginsengisoli TaxID=453575 RepID=UPI00101FC964|nr:poly-beta-1,6 N-acetyl-D-glucosamine export porin PgaA [Allopusillimonas ginsengisoli]TEA77205.1 poly-beta-1,6 N-acetyl-D-glucosamine export porin PgaA [Allopusillimonas ginsengisoli]